MDLLLTAVCHFVDGAAGVDEEVLALIVKRYRQAIEAAGLARATESAPDPAGALADNVLAEYHADEES